MTPRHVPDSSCKLQIRTHPGQSRPRTPRRAELLILKWLLVFGVVSCDFPILERASASTATNVIAACLFPGRELAEVGVEELKALNLDNAEMPGCLSNNISEPV